jgi:Zn-dependent peptidase ImmA (M78 family)/DNA-binding XRE family transcriptional regulator
MIGQRLKTARSAAGLSLRDLEERIGNRVTAQAMSKYERDEMMPSSDVLIALARALSVSEDYLLGEQALELDGVEFRKKAHMSGREEAQVQARVMQLVERYLTVEEVLGLPLNWDEPREAPYPVSKDISEADRGAHFLREHWGLGLGPITKLVELLENRGIKVLAIDADKMDGLTARVKRRAGSAVPVIVINGKDWSERKRFNLAHELGHLVLDVADPLNPEKAAHRFAGAFLLPAEALWSEIGKHRTSISLGELQRLKELFGASLQAITYRCHDLGIINRPLFKELFDLFQARGWREPPYEEPGALAPKDEDPTRLERLCLRALAEGVISESKAAELLGISAHELNVRLDQSERATPKG